MAAHEGFDEAVQVDGATQDPAPVATSALIKIGIDRGTFRNPFVEATGQSQGPGWFCAGFGPFRRFTGGEVEPEGLQNLGRYLSLFDERYALSSSLQWLGDLHHSSLTPESSEQRHGIQRHSREAYSRVRAFLNQPGFLPLGVKLESVVPRYVEFKDSDGTSLAIEDLSDGFRSALSLVIELLRQLLAVFGLERVLAPGANVANVPGVVLIDEVDVHLHPTWQRGIGEFLTRAFPQMQFIVTTHSPLACPAAERGSIFLLPEVGGSGARFVTDLEKRRLVFGNVLDALSTGAFGPVSQSEVGADRRKRLAELNTKELAAGLTRTETDERSALRAELPSRGATLKASD